MEEPIQIQTAKSELSKLTVKDLFYKYIRFFPLFIISIALSLLVAFLYLRYATLIYQSTGSMVIQDDQNGRGDDRLDQILTSDSKKNILNEIEFLKSAKLMARVVNALDLNFTYTAIGKIKELNIYRSCPFTVEAFELKDSSQFTLNVDFESPNRFRINGDGPFIFGDVFKNQHGVFRLLRGPSGSANGQYKVTWSRTSSVASGLTSHLVVSPKQGTGILVLLHESPNAQLSADVVNSVMDQYQKAIVEDKNAKTQAQLVFIDDRLNAVSKQVDSINTVYVNFVKQNSAYNLETQSTNFLGQIEEGAKNRSVQQDLLNKTYQIENSLITKTQTVKVPSSLGIDDPTLNKLVDTYNEAQLQRKALLETTSPQNIAVKHQEEIIDQLQKNILSNLGNIKTALRSSIGTVDRLTGSAQAQLRVMPEKQRVLEDIKMQQQSKIAVLNNLLEKREESAIQLAATISNIKVLQDAVPNTNPVKPDRRNIQLLAVVIGLVLPALFIFILELTNDKVTTRYDIERLTSATILGEVGHSYQKQSLVVTNNNRSVVAEQFRIIRSNLQYVLNHVQKPVILVSSSFSGEGKSFISTNVGAVLALAGKKTVILEFDIRKPKVLTHLNMPKHPGLTNYILGKAAIEDLPVKVDGTDNLYVLPCGPVPPNPAELLLDPRINDLFSWLRENFDVVVMDTAPVGMVSDAMTLSRFADATLYIVRQGHTFKKQIGMIDEFYVQGKLPKISIILNDVKVRSGYGYYGYGRYGYGYGYGYGSDYFEEEKPVDGKFEKWFGWMDVKKWNKRKKSKV
ncbi:MAG TPA: polysaccharide biosynthesis tyrosine autokinase [Flavisolibacter sp.]|nr:polysaccharide biosynthesis tyrosine autokinase [Flavisolibacter sp.]